MSKLILCEDDFSQFVPNYIRPVKGEKHLFERVAIFVDMAEKWVVNNLLGDESYSHILSLEQNDYLRVLTCRLICADALYRAIPSLDIVLSPNGFGVAESSALKPASKTKVDRLMESILDIREALIPELISNLNYCEVWKLSDKGKFFAASLFTDFSVLDKLVHRKQDGSVWNHYLAVRAKIIDIEESLAEDYFSFNLLNALREESFLNCISQNRFNVVLAIRNIIFGYLDKGSLDSKKIGRIIDFIKKNPDDFEEWHSSDVAKLFNPPVFRNDMSAGGFFF